ncbi:MAG TPA: hypothetical protein VD863_06925 [Bradyrhizobium sp.]|nr:hypothetical protein [Bradyrhizobium sp.]
MTERIPELMDRLAMVERDSRDHARSIGEIVLDQRGVKGEVADMREKTAIREAVRVEAAKHMEERFDRIEAALKSVFDLGKWILGAIGSVLIVAIIGVVLRGGPLG